MNLLRGQRFKLEQVGVNSKLKLEDLKCDIKSITCTIGVQGKQTCWSMIIINLTDEKIEIPTNNIFDANSLPLSLILKNNAKSTK